MTLHTDADPDRTAPASDDSPGFPRAAGLFPGVEDGPLWAALRDFRDGVALFGSDRCLVSANEAFLALFDGLDAVAPGCHRDTLLTLMVEEGIVDPGARSTRDWLNVMRSNWETASVDPPVLRLWNGRLLRLAAQGTEAGGMIVLLSDISDHIAREGRSDRARDAAEAACRAKSRFLVTISHEIRTPIAAVVGLADTLSQTRLDPAQRDAVDAIRSSGQALLELVSDTLDYSRMEFDRIALKSRPFDLERCLHDVVSLLGPMAADKGLDLAVDYDLFLPTSFSGDAGRIRQVLTNLVGNAIKFTETGQVTVRVVGLPNDQSRGYRVHVTVEDTGTGIAPEMLPRVFDEFSQVGPDDGTRAAGSGLGLAISKKLVELMGGEIWADSTPGVGSGFGFRLTLPALDDLDATAMRAPRWVSRALVLDAGESGATILAKQLTFLGLRTTRVSSAEALCALSPGARDLVFLDIAATRDPAGLIETLRDGAPPGGVFIVADTPCRTGNSGANATLRRPVLRADLFRAIAGLAPPLPGDLGHERPEIEPDRPAACDGPRPMRVLAAEDNRTSRFLIQKMLNGLEIDLEFAENGVEAVELYRSFRPDILFIDMSMPRMDGADAARRIRALEMEADFPRCPIIGMTAHAIVPEAGGCDGTGIDSYMSKPLRKQTILGQILAAQPEGTLPVIGQCARPGAVPVVRRRQPAGDGLARASG